MTLTIIYRHGGREDREVSSVHEAADIIARSTHDIDGYKIIDGHKIIACPHPEAVH